MNKNISLPLLALLPVSPAQAQQFEDLAVLDAQVASAVGEGSVKPLDRRLKLARCPEPVTLDTNTPNVVALRCNAIGWRIRVPVTLSFGASDAGQILVKRGDTVEIIFQGDNFEIASSGVALDDGVAGKRIRVKSSAGGSPVSGIVAGQSLIYIKN